MRSTRAILATAGLIGLLALAGCGSGGSGGSGSSGSSGPPGSIKVTMTEFKFDPSSISAKAGTVTFFLINSGTVAHDMVINGPNGSQVASSELVQPGNTSVFTVNNLTAGTYPFLCNQPGHAEAGMKGTLTVT